MITHEELMFASDEDKELFRQWTEWLPNRDGVNGDNLDRRGVPIPYYSGPHIIRHFRTVLDIVKPKRVFEIGLCVGASASFVLHLSDAYVFSVDVSDRDETVNAGLTLKDVFPDRFDFEIVDSGTILERMKTHDPYDMIYIDGDHEEAGVTKDIQMAIDLNIPYIFFDDIMPNYGPGVAISIAKFPELELVKDMDNLRLYKNIAWQIH
jgi:hypothetical protein